MAQAPGTAENGGTSSQQYIVAVNQPYVPSVSPVASSYNPASCVSWVKFKRPDQDEPWGSPSRIQVYDLEPRPGLIVITTEGPVGHAAYIESVQGGMMKISECNFVPGKCTTRLLSTDSSVIRGYR